MTAPGVPADVRRLALRGRKERIMKSNPQTIAEQRAWDQGAAFRRAHASATVKELADAAEKAALGYIGEPAGRSTVRYDAYEQFRRYIKWFAAGYAENQ